MKLLILLCFGVTVFLGCSSTPKIVAPSAPEGIQEEKPQVQVVEIKNLKFTAESFFSEKKDLEFQEIPADNKYQEWAEEAIHKVNELLPKDAIVPVVKIKLIFEALITNSNGKKKLTPISIIESYQEPKTNSMRLGMAELKDDKKSFQLTVAHEYAHLVLENASRTAGTTSKDSDGIEFWSKPIYEGVADLFMSFALDSELTAGRDNWSSRSIYEFSNLDDAKKAKDSTIQKARSAFRKMGLIPQFPIYEDWLTKVEKYISSLGGIDPYAEGRWLAGSIRKLTKTKEDKKAIVAKIVQSARSGEIERDIKTFESKLRE